MLFVLFTEHDLKTSVIVLLLFILHEKENAELLGIKSAFVLEFLMIYSNIGILTFLPK